MQLLSPVAVHTCVRWYRPFLQARPRLSLDRCFRQYLCSSEIRPEHTRDKVTEIAVYHSA
jgi:hypothetical protein